MKREYKVLVIALVAAAFILSLFAFRLLVQ
ncbi:hypothetical protein J2R98_000052 [Alkalibacillus filiformis]|uniref:Uncharacterized protein n=1 Tax=Alkalibacillus filiformis TaxID=200990 RepID=A0ABU0DP87_9BACI|nr:hypothetical protein [Alkalibacillus filiformis]